MILTHTINKEEVGNFDVVINIDQNLEPQQLSALKKESIYVDLRTSQDSDALVKSLNFENVLGVVVKNT